MFNSLTGTITAKLPQTLYLRIGTDTSAIEWELLTPDSSLDALPAVGECATVYTWLYHHEDSMRLFGFASVDERLIFLDLLKVDGVGPKAALKILSNTPAKALASIIDEENLGMLEKIPGIGKKTAQKMLLSLKGKLTVFADDAKLSPRKASSKWDDVTASLVAMGFDKKSVEAFIAKTLEEFEKDGKDLSKNKKEIEDALLRRAIVELAN